MDKKKIIKMTYQILKEIGMVFYAVTKGLMSFIWLAIGYLVLGSYGVAFPSYLIDWTLTMAFFGTYVVGYREAAKVEK